PGSVHLGVKQVDSTDVIELSVESNSATNAEKFARALPGTYLKYFSGTRKAEIGNALNFAQKRLDDENKNLKRASDQLQRVRQKSRIYSVEAERKNKITEQQDAQDAQQKIAAQVAAEEARLNRLVAERAAQPVMIESQTQTTNVQIETIRSSIAAL